MLPEEFTKQIEECEKYRDKLAQLETLHSKWHIQDVHDGVCQRKARYSRSSTLTLSPLREQLVLDRTYFPLRVDVSTFDYVYWFLTVF